MRKTKTLTAVVLGSALALAGCGGSDDEDEAALTAITEANAATVSAVVYRAASVLFDVASTSGTLPLGVVAQGASGTSGGSFGLAGFAAQQLKAATSRPLPAASGAVGAVYEETYSCSGGGTVTERTDDADNNGVPSIGDSLKLTFTNCVEEGVTANGIVSFKLTLVTESSMGADVKFDDLFINDGTDVIGTNGGFNLVLTENPGVSEVYEIAGNALTATLNGDQHKLTSFTGTATVDLVLGSTTYSFNGGVSDTSNNISVNAETLAAFVAQAADDYPGSGSMLITGAANSQALLEALSSTLVQISVDPDGDGSFTAPVEWTWSELEAVPD